MPVIHKATPTPVVASVIPTFYVEELESALAWYCRCLRFKVLAFNPNFATLEMSPGRICWINKNAAKKGQGTTNFHVRDTEEFHRHLVREGVDADPLEIGVAGTFWFQFRDPDGNTFGVWSGLFGLNETENVNGPDFPQMVSYTFVKLPAIRCAGVEVTADIRDPESALSDAASELVRLTAGLDGALPGLLCINPILERYTGVTEHKLLVCRKFAEDAAVPEQLLEQVIPEQHYAVFSFERTRHDFRTDYPRVYRWLGMQFGFLKAAPGAPNAYHLEFTHEDSIEVYIPYAAGPNETHEYC
ncbi:VOC family protein [Paenibacillus mesophilus]|uniref:VOC family protein n=1 Tax=Paenibacillus mesophilus TaxID=2582849 RepID=UPI0013054602|nr:VOC family protein [Paenibacillus mesophilus]